MRRVVDKSKNGLQVVKLVHPVNGSTLSYNVEDTKLAAGHKGFVVASALHSLVDARRVAGISVTPPVRETLPKSAYDEQRTGYKKPAPSRR